MVHQINDIDIKEEPIITNNTVCKREIVLNQIVEKDVIMIEHKEDQVKNKNINRYDEHNTIQRKTTYVPSSNSSLLSVDLNQKISDNK